jgi:hypothetical protein
MSWMIIACPRERLLKKSGVVSIETDSGEVNQPICPPLAVFCRRPARQIRLSVNCDDDKVDQHVSGLFAAGSVRAASQMK